ncbi:MAG: AmmeMemoRadiSam system protein B [Myxococcales bacterium]|nr:AmmeMemoRadiSam system protein B [Myxococcales bacterium]
MATVRPPSVAGFFYPDDPRSLEREVRGFLDDAETAAKTAAKTDSETEQAPTTLSPKALIVPHAGFRFSGPIAASAYRHLVPRRKEIKRVVLLGPSHRVPLEGLGASSAEAFETPLGKIPLDREATLRSLKLPQVSINDEAHADEHSLEVQLPFLQILLESFTLVPFSVGDAKGKDVAEVLEELWGGDETLVVISSDLSHYLSYAEARARDAETTRAIETLQPDLLDWESACGRVAARGLLLTAREKKLTVHTLDVRNSGDTQGGHDRVVGYGAWAFVQALGER